ncbi:diguanylate cyclase (GGDEF) domain-containing protein [Desulforamulus putei DSM 12395]|uniref:Diguanylate cyclase (GGDEF) domain-containing protein n=1 Tax=Desulforamulus putei DSM 12395 TaxID=1121429 RepID=A0A1M4ZH91_9FIRM|nr:GGDEF domain-containing protein [Desulforamulus putei]SHF16956.1 diguanylate cyclase (GGDEF) domain-containing protein [Desulforamulus putei DSM 12395]
MKQPAVLIPPFLLGVAGTIGQVKTLLWLSQLLWLIAVLYIMVSHRREKTILLQKLKTQEEKILCQTARQAGESFRLMMANCTDGLTGVANRKHLDSRLAEMIKNDSVFSVIMLDIDHFKKVNDTYGHQAGDEVLKHFAKTISKTVRLGDLVARYGGEEFAVICLSDAQNTRKVAERIREAVEATPVQTCAGTIKITASLGVAQRRPEDTVESLIQRADGFLYQAKQEGRNRVKGE